MVWCDCLCNCFLVWLRSLTEFYFTKLGLCVSCRCTCILVWLLIFWWYLLYLFLFLCDPFAQLCSFFFTNFAFVCFVWITVFWGGFCLSSLSRLVGQYALVWLDSLSESWCDWLVTLCFSVTVLSNCVLVWLVGLIMFWFDRSCVWLLCLTALCLTVWLICLTVVWCVCLV